MDALGELRPIYEPPLVREMLASGTDSITVTLCDPKPLGADLEFAVDGLMEYDRYLAKYPDLFVKATSVGHIDEARRSGRMAVFYLYQNTIQFDDDLDRADMFHRLGLTSCQITYNERNLAGVGCRAEGDDEVGGRPDLVDHQQPVPPHLIEGEPYHALVARVQLLDVFPDRHGERNGLLGDGGTSREHDEGKSHTRSGGTTVVHGLASFVRWPCRPGRASTDVMLSGPRVLVPAGSTGGRRRGEATCGG